MSSPPNFIITPLSLDSFLNATIFYSPGNILPISWLLRIAMDGHDIHNDLIKAWILRLCINKNSFYDYISGKISFDEYRNIIYDDSESLKNLMLNDGSHNRHQGLTWNGVENFLILVKIFKVIRAQITSEDARELFEKHWINPKNNDKTIISKINQIIENIVFF